MKDADMSGYVGWIDFRPNVLNALVRTGINRGVGIERRIDQPQNKEISK